jgi:uncharacterized protein with FMN-binding domain
MRKGIVIVLAVAIIGALGIYGKSSGHSGSTGVNSSASQTTGTSSSANTLGAQTSSSNTSSASGSFKDGTYTGNSEDTPYGSVQIAVAVSGGKITSINFLQLPNDQGHSQEVSAFAAPLLKQETLQKQSANIDFVSGATSTSEGYQRSLQSALNQA